MKLHLENQSRLYIQAYTLDEIVISNNIYRCPLLITEQTVIPHWKPPALAAFSLDALKPALSDQLEVFILGTGSRLLFPPMQLAAQLARMRIGFEVMDNGAACRTYNVLVSEGRVVATGLLPDQTPQESTQ